MTGQIRYRGALPSDADPGASRQPAQTLTRVVAFRNGPAAARVVLMVGRHEPGRPLHASGVFRWVRIPHGPAPADEGYASMLRTACVRADGVPTTRPDRARPQPGWRRVTPAGCEPLRVVL